MEGVAESSTDPLPGTSHFLSCEIEDEYEQTPKLARKWSTEKERLLCELWEKERYLYDNRHKEYRNTELRNIAFKRFANILGESGE